MGNDRDDLDRRLQAQMLRDIMKNSTNPLVFLGYVTSAPMSRDYRVLTSAAQDIDPTDHDRWCEYILYKNLIRYELQTSSVSLFRNDLDRSIQGRLCPSDPWWFDRYRNSNGQISHSIGCR